MNTDLLLLIMIVVSIGVVAFMFVFLNKSAKEQEQKKLEKAATVEWHRKDVERQARQKIEDEEKLWRSRVDRLRNSHAFELIKAYVNKYTINDESSSFFKLVDLIKLDGFEFTYSEVRQILLEEKVLDTLLRDKERLLKVQANSTKEMILAFLDIFPVTNESNVASLRAALSDKGLGEFSLAKLQEKVDSARKEEELVIFKKNLLNNNPSPSGIDTVDRLPGHEFERYLGNLFAAMGFQVEQTKLSRDHGADLILKKFGEIILVQAKRSSSPVGNSAIQQVVASLKMYGASKGIVVTNATYTTAAYDLATANSIQLIDRGELKSLIERHL